LADAHRTVIMERLLGDIAGDGYPSDYLLARVRARRVGLVTDWRRARAPGAAAESDDAIWSGLLREFAWVRTQMNRELRRRFAGIFLLFEVKTLILCLRNRAARRDAEVDRLLRGSQLNDALRHALQAGQALPDAVAAVAAAWGRDAADAEALRQAYAADGLHGFEHRLVRSLVERISAASLHPAIRRFFERYVDARNLMILHKHLRWNVHANEDFLPGGTIDRARLTDASVARNRAWFEGQVRAFVGRPVAPIVLEENALETTLLGRLSQDVRSLRQESDAVGLLLEYLWRAYVHARNRAVLAHVADGGPDVLDREIIA
jgi:hypothetical protein